MALELLRVTGWPEMRCLEGTRKGRVNEGLEGSEEGVSGVLTSIQSVR